MIDIKTLREIANSYEELANRLYKNGLMDEAEFGYAAAAALDTKDLELQNSWGGAFNGQAARIKLVQKIIEIWNPDAVIETGTFRGVTTKWLGEHNRVPIYTCESNRRFFLQSQQLLEHLANVHVEFRDSREFLRKYAGTEISKKKVLFYLDAHWNEELPLREEIQIILSGFEFPLIIIDDFRVPFDEGYRYDDYGENKILSLEILEGLLSPDICVGFPLTPSEFETGAKRGSVLLAPKHLVDILTLTKLIRLSDPRDYKLLELESIIKDRSIKQLEEEISKHKSIINTLNSEKDELQYHADARWNQINILTEMVRDLQMKIKDKKYLSK